MSLGLQPYLEPYITEPESIAFRRWQNGKVIGKTKLVPDFVDTFRAPYYVIHRADFHSALFQRALDVGVQIYLGARVVGFDPVEGSIELGDGTKRVGDLVVAADGLLSCFCCVVIGELTVHRDQIRGSEVSARREGNAV